MKSMKKFKIVFAAAVLFAAAAVDAAAQGAPDVVIALQPISAMTSAIMNTQAMAQIENAIKFASMVENAVSTAKNTYDQLKRTIDAEARALKNLTSAGNIRSYDDFMSWTNRQLDLERAASESYQQTTVKIGNSTRGLVDIAGLLDNWKTYRVSESERSLIYQQLGLSPANYAYASTWKAIELDMFDESIAMVDAYREKRKKDAALRAEMAENYKNAGEDGLTENSLAKDANALQIQSIDVQEDIRDELADMNKRQAVEFMKKQTVYEPARVSNTFAAGLGDSPVNASSVELDD